MDPWLIGTGFIGGWSPLSCSRISDIPTFMNYLWISHEHPDHFSPPTLTKLFEHWQKLPSVLFQETVDDRVINWFNKKGCKVQVLKDNKRLILDKLELRLQKFGLYDSILQIRNETECFTNLNDAPIKSASHLRLVREFAGNRHHVMTSQYGVANSENSVGDKEGWETAVEEKKRLFAFQVKTIQPDICIPAASSVHFCAEDNLYMNKYRVNPAVFATGDYKFGTNIAVLLPLPSQKVETNTPKEIEVVNNNFEKYYNDLLKKKQKILLFKKIRELN